MNDSKYSNNLRHLLRIFFEREIKTKHSLSVFGSLFKGSKWSDYQTFNINNFFINSGLHYFYYITTVLLFIMIFLGRSKAEQYLGFIPFFSYIDFILGYVPLALGDLWSQVILYIYIIYLTLMAVLNKFVEYITTNLFLSIFANNKNHINTSLTKQGQLSRSGNSTGVNTTLIKTQHTLHYNNFYNFSKQLNNLKSKIYTINYLLPQKKTTTTPINLRLPILSIKGVYTNNNTTLNRLQVSTESKYTSNLLNTSLSSSYSKNLNLNLNYLQRFYLLNKLPATFNFNIGNNIVNSKQSRWLTHNSLLSNSFLINTSLFTQAKKLLGLGLFSKEFSKDSLWLPTKTTKNSSLESTKYITSVTNLLNYNHNYINSFIINNKLTHAKSNNLNFFENSRLWLLKRYFFSTQYVHNNTLEFNKVLSTVNQVTNPLNSVTNFNYTSTTYLSNLRSYINSNNLLVTYNTHFNRTSNPLSNNLNNKEGLYLHLPSLDILAGNNLSLFLLITSNPQNLNNNLNYFNNLLTLGNKTLSLSLDTTKVYFSNK